MEIIVMLCALSVAVSLIGIVLNLYLFFEEFKKEV